MTYIRNEKFGLFMLALPIFVTAISDIAAYLTGKSIGKHKLFPVISPKKTVEGSIGGILCTASIFLLLGYILDKTGVISVYYGKFTVYLILSVVIGQFGDFALSSVKRITKIKDYGSIFPGHGGVLDRFDSLLYVLPFTYLFCIFTGTIFL